MSSSLAVPLSAEPVRTHQRVYSVDLLRGIVMVIMALDHTREFVHSTAMAYRPEDLAQWRPVQAQAGKLRAQLWRDHSRLQAHPDGAGRNSARTRGASAR